MKERFLLQSHKNSTGKHRKRGPTRNEKWDDHKITQLHQPNTFPYFGYGSWSTCFIHSPGISATCWFRIQTKLQSPSPHGQPFATHSGRPLYRPCRQRNKDREEIKVINWAYVNAASLGWKLESGAIRCSAQSNEALCADLSRIRSAAHSSLFSSYLRTDLACEEDITLPSHRRQLKMFTPKTTPPDGHTSSCLQISI